ncbi:hypothetical protein PROFUN_00139 [Planoprotostelium fungivorum]|uniref:ornithine decarboxylase n=1 Tax=Planoprotostelium fungivorum TaxID=1890364 RepID=A0A2P6P0S7_9EUKA|nr:hypothetical protein PROFUN_00139 [Planoprotostelium fungivorum]
MNAYDGWHYLRVGVHGDPQQIQMIVINCSGNDIEFIVLCWCQISSSSTRLKNTTQIAPAHTFKHHTPSFAAERVDEHQQKHFAFHAIGNTKKTPHLVFRIPGAHSTPAIHQYSLQMTSIINRAVARVCENVTMTQYKVPKDVKNKWSVEATGDRHIEEILAEKAADREDAFFIIDLGRVTDKYKRWKEELPTVKPFFAIKCNPNTAIIRTLASLGTGFDCASMAEMRQVLGCGVSPSDIIFANPTKMRSHIEFAKSAGIKLMTFDNRDELTKIHSIYPEAELVLRIITDDSHSVCGFSSKFGAPLSSVDHLLSTASSIGCTVRGVSFHVGSNCLSPLAFEKAILSAAAVFRVAEGYGYRMDFLDLGGGWPGVDGAEVTFPDMAAAVRPLLPLFPPHVRVIAEPGRYFVADSHTLAVNIYAKRATDDGSYLYYVNDGVYQSFNCIYFDHYSPRPRLLGVSEKGEEHRSTLFGPTCDSIDCVAKDIYLPELHVGDWLYFTNMGAYTVAAASSFNGFDACPTTFYIESDI